jgi:iron(II)-dependent oxidoreductase
MTAMIRAPAGRFRVGSDSGGYREKPAFEVDLPELYIAVSEVTVGEYARFLETSGAGKAAEPLLWAEQKAHPDRPVTGVSLADAKAYAQSLGLDLPTESEWERAAACGDGRIWPFGDKFDPAAANTFEARRKAPSAVGEFSGDVSPLGCRGMAGNVAEWTTSPFKAYEGGTGDFPEGQFVIRGGDFSFGSKFARCAVRRGVSPDARKDFIGFRVVRRVTISSLSQLG